MNKIKIGTLTIGQSPRSDIIPEIIPLLGDEFEIIEAGALDGLDTDYIEMNISPQNNEIEQIIQVSRMTDGTEVEILQSKVVPLLEKQIAYLENCGVEFIVLLCNDPFIDLKSNVKIIYPEPIIHYLAFEISKTKKIGVIMPNETQLERAKNLLLRYNLDATVVSISPYRKVDCIKKSLEPIMSEDIDVVVLECLGYGNEFKNIVKKLTGKKVILVREMIFTIIRTLYS